MAAIHQDLAKSELPSPGCQQLLCQTLSEYDGHPKAGISSTCIFLSALASLKILSLISLSFDAFRQLLKPVIIAEAHTPICITRGELLNKHFIRPWHSKQFT